MSAGVPVSTGVPASSSGAAPPSSPHPHRTIKPSSPARMKTTISARDGRKHDHRADQSDEGENQPGDGEAGRARVLADLRERPNRDAQPADLDRPDAGHERGDPEEERQPRQAHLLLRL